MQCVSGVLAKSYWQYLWAELESRCFRLVTSFRRSTLGFMLSESLESVVCFIVLFGCFCTVIIGCLRLTGFGYGCI